MRLRVSSVWPLAGTALVALGLGLLVIVPARADGSTFYFTSANGGYLQDLALDPDGNTPEVSTAKGAQAPDGSKLLPAAPTGDTTDEAHAYAVANNDAVYGPSLPDIPTFSLNFNGKIDAICVDAWVESVATPLTFTFVVWNKNIPAQNQASGTVTASVANPAGPPHVTRITAYLPWSDGPILAVQAGTTGVPVGVYGPSGGPDWKLLYDSRYYPSSISINGTAGGCAPSPVPTAPAGGVPSADTSMVPTANPSVDPSAVPTVNPNEYASMVPTVDPNVYASMLPSDDPTDVVASASATVDGTVDGVCGTVRGASPTAMPDRCSPEPSPSPSPTETEASPTPSPTEASPTPSPTEASPTPSPTEASPTPSPTEASPTPSPTEASPTPSPTEASPTPSPTEASPSPTDSPSPSPTFSPTPEPTFSPTPDPTPTPELTLTPEPTPSPTPTVPEELGPVVTVPYAVGTTTVPVSVTDPGAGFTSYAVGEDAAECTPVGANPTPPSSLALAAGPDRLVDVVVSGTLASGHCRYGHALVQLDRTAPVATASIRSLTGTDARTVVSWDGTDAAPASGIASWRVEIDEASGRRVRTLTPTTPGSLTLDLRPGSSYVVRASAVDYAGNSGPVVTTAHHAVPLDDAVFARRGDWSRRPTAQAWYGGHARGVGPGAWVSRRVDAARYDLVFTAHPTGGYVEVWVDGKLVRRVDTYSATTVYRKVVRLASYPTRAARTITLRIASAHNRASRGYVLYLDALHALY